MVLGQSSFLVGLVWNDLTLESALSWWLVDSSDPSATPLPCVMLIPTLLRLGFVGSIMDEHIGFEMKSFIWIYLFIYKWQLSGCTLCFFREVTPWSLWLQSLLRVTVSLCTYRLVKELFYPYKRLRHLNTDLKDPYEIRHTTSIICCDVGEKLPKSDS